MDGPELAKMLESLGIEATPAPAGEAEAAFQAARDTDEGHIGFTVSLEQDWLLITVSPFLNTRGNNSFELARWLLRQNRDMYQAKFGYDPSGNVVLSIELPTEALGAEEVRLSIEALVQYAVEHRGTLRAASRPPPRA